MGDSEDEYDRKRRDKFRGERTESYPRGDGRRTAGDERRREDWIERDFQRSRGTHPRGDYREYRGGGGRERYSPSRAQDMVPPVKRLRTEWGDDRRGMGGYGHEGTSYENYSSGWQHYPTHSPAYPNANASRSSGSEGVETQPAMLSFKNYLQTQDDNITDEDALKKYNEYKREFKRQQLNEFFVTHKEEEWFKIKYHPEEAVKRKDDQTSSLKKRVNVFQELDESARFEKISVDSDKSEDLIKLLDIAVILLEGGNEQDILALQLRSQGNFKESSYSSKQDATEKAVEEPAEKPTSKPAEEEPKPFVLGGDEEEAKVEDNDKPSSPSSEPLALQITMEQEQLQKKAKEFSKQKSTEGEGEAGGEYSDSSDSEPPTPTGDVNGVTDEPPPPGLDEEKEPEESGDEDEEVDKTEGEVEEGQDEAEEGEKDAKSDNGAEDISDKDDDQKDKEEREEGEEGMDIDELNKEKSGRSTPELNKPRCLHRTSSIFLRNLAPTITKQEVEAMCKRYQGFLRVAIADPQPERRWFRRGWVTFQRHVNIKDICWNLNNIRLRDCELGAIVNRDLTRRIRTVNGITSHKEVIRNDIKLAARMVHNLDSRTGLWAMSPSQEEDKKSDAKTKQDDWPLSFGLDSKNPVLKNITDYLIEEASAEEEELLGITADSEEGQLADEGSTIVRDENLIRVLDRLLMYLRIVHSVDYYNHCEYPNEDEMPNRMGIMHARGIPPPTKQLSPQEVSDYCSMFEQKIASFLQPIPKISEDEYSKLGHKDPDAEVEKFVKANTQELAKDKWLCPLSGKKFKGPEFVRKHIFNKHAEKVDEVKKEVEYFNNYLRDPKRPQLPEHPGNRSGARKDGPSDRETFNSPLQPYMQPQYAGSYGGGYGHRHGGFVSGHGYPGPYSQGYNQGYSTRPNRGGYRGRSPNANVPARRIIAYHDLDAPVDAD